MKCCCATPRKTVLYVSSEKFINQFVDHSRSGDVADFVYFYQLIDVLDYRRHSCAGPRA